VAARPRFGALRHTGLKRGTAGNIMRKATLVGMPKLTVKVCAQEDEQPWIM